VWDVQMDLAVVWYWMGVLLRETSAVYEEIGHRLSKGGDGHYVLGTFQKSCWFLEVIGEWWLCYSLLNDRKLVG